MEDSMLQPTLKYLLAGVVLLACAGCLNIGPRTIARDRFDYTAAISDSWKDQMLLNLVKLRYADAPIFLDIASITNQYEFQQEVNLSASWKSGLLGNEQGAGARGRYSDRPTITYTPLMGDKFKQIMMLAIPPESILNMVQSGWEVEFVYRMCVGAVNGIYNRSGRRIAGRKTADTKFYTLLENLSQIQGSGALGVRVKSHEGGGKTVLYFHSKTHDAINDEIQKVKELLGLNPKAREFVLASGAIAENDTEISVLTRTMLEILVELSTLITVPSEHVEENRAYKQAEAWEGINPLLVVKSQKNKPDDDFVSVRYRDYWFWIDDRDLYSKRTFSFLMFLFSLAETGSAEMAPILTIPAG
jgi:hypothetical protein